MKHKVIAILLYFLVGTQVIGTIFQEPDFPALFAPILTPVDQVFHLAGKYNFFAPRRSFWDGSIAYATIEKEFLNHKAKGLLREEFSFFGKVRSMQAGSIFAFGMKDEVVLESHLKNVAHFVHDKNDGLLALNISYNMLAIPPIGEAGVISTREILSRRIEEFK